VARVAAQNGDGNPTAASRQRSYIPNANCYVAKPVDFDRFLSILKAIDGFWLTVVALPGGASG